MKKLPIIPLLFILGACGKSGTTETNAVALLGEVRPLVQNQLSAGDRDVMTTVCNVLGIKESALPQAVGSTLVFDTLETDCSNGTKSSGPLDTVIQQSGNNYVLKRKLDGLDFFFPNIETQTTGAFASFCSSINLATNPQISGTSAIYVSTNASGANCPSVSGEICIQIDYASVQNNQLVVNAVEWMRVRTNLNVEKTGYFTYRKKVTKSFCGQGEGLTFEATLK